MLNQFSRLETLIGRESLEKLFGKHVAIFGLGGVGGFTAEALARCGIGKFDLIDSDKVDLTNLNRQIYALHSTVGKYKVDVAEQRILDINPDAEITKHQIFYTNDVSFDFSKYDYVIDAIDTVSAKISIIEECKKNNIPVISAMGAGNKMNPLDFRVADISKTTMCPLAKVIRQELKKRKISKVKVVYSIEPPAKSVKENEKGSIKKHTPSSNSFCPSVMGLIIASEVVKDIIKK